MLSLVHFYELQSHIRAGYKPSESCSVDMSGLVEKVKGVVRNRSRHRQTESIDSTRPRTASDQYVLAQETSNARSITQESQRGRNSGLQSQNGLDGTTRSFAAMNVNDTHVATTTTTTTTGPQAGALPPLPSNATENIESARAQTGALNSEYQNERPVDGNQPTPRTPTHQGNISGPHGGSGSQGIDPEIVPDRDSSMRRKPLPSAKTETNPHVLDNMSTGRDGMSQPRGPRSYTGHKHNRSTDVAPNDPSPLLPHFTTRSAASPTSPTFSSNNGDDGAVRETQHRDLRLPANFDLSNTERTHVEIKVAPAVTQEKVHIQRTELVTKAVHRDVHIDHHYTYVQPIPVVEILPARHFRLDPITGVKTEIPAPPGYKLPAHLEPRKAEDYSHLRQTARHYVVDEDHPNGQLESQP